MSVQIDRALVANETDKEKHLHATYFHPLGSAANDR